jgi:ABC-type polysaccharide/polyol phosphate export permease
MAWRDRFEHSALWQLTLTRSLGFLREPEAVFWVFVFPLLLALALGIAFRSQKPQPVPVAVAPSETSAAVVAALGASPDLRVVPTATEAEAELALRSGKIVALVRPAATGEASSLPNVQIAYDPTRQEGRLADLLVRDALGRAAGRVDPVNVEAVPERRRGARYIDFLLPGLIGMNLMGTGMWGVGFPIAAARQQKLLKRYMATPMRRSEYLLSFLLSRLVWLVLEVAVLMLFGRLVFGIRVTGSWPAYATVVLLGALSFSALGLLVVSRARTIEAVSGLMNVAMLPMWLLSGTFFSAERFPKLLQPVIQALPLTAVNDALRALVNEGAGWGAVLPSLLLVVAWGFACFTAAMKLFRWE